MARPPRVPPPRGGWSEGAVLLVNLHTTRKPSHIHETYKGHAGVARGVRCEGMLSRDGRVYSEIQGRAGGVRAR